MGSLLTWVAGRRMKWVVFLVWLVGIGVAAGPLQLPAKLSGAEKNEDVAFLPSDAESTRALELAKRIQGGEQVAAVVVYRRAGGLQPADRALVQRDVRELNALGLPGVGPFQVGRASPDGSALLVVGDIRATGDSDRLLDVVKRIRTTVDDPGGGLETAVTGPAGFSADAIEVFGGIDGTLLLAAVTIVFVLLALIYRSPIFLWIPLLAVGFAEVGSRSLAYGLTQIGATANSQTTGITSVLVLGAATDYALLLVSRYREELRRHADREEAVRRALRTAGPAIFASGITVICALLTLMLAEVNSTSGLGPIAAAGVLAAMLAMLTALPAMLAIVPRGVFWPRVPRLGQEGADETHGVWRRIGDRVARRPRPVWLGVGLLLGLLCLGMLNLGQRLPQDQQYTNTPESVRGQQLLAQAFPAGATAPTDVVVRDPADAPAVARALQGVPGVVAVQPVARSGAGVVLQATLRPEPYSDAALDLVPRIRAAAARAAGDGQVLVGGPSAIERDLGEASARDTRLIVPIALGVVFLILVALLRAVLGPVLLVASNLLSFGAALGVGALAFELVFGFDGTFAALPLYIFIFLVALGIDYNIFLMARVREETLRHGTRDGMLRGLAVTGAVITSAGIVLAGTFSVLMVLPLVVLVEVGFIVAFGVLLDTFVVRSVLVPALVLDVGRRFWWPSRLARSDRGSMAAAPAGPAGDGRDGDGVGAVAAGVRGAAGSGRAPTG